MQLTLTDAESDLLRELLHDYLPELRREVARTEAREFRHRLVQRQELAERMLAELSPAAA
jgi:hypothetical protein